VARENFFGRSHAFDGAKNIFSDFRTRAKGVLGRFGSFEWGDFGEMDFVCE
jgi:hypothetical protein